MTALTRGFATTKDNPVVVVVGVVAALLVIGVLADTVGVITVLFLYAPVVLAVAAYGLLINRRYGAS